MTVHEIIEIGEVLLGLANSLPEPAHAFDKVVGVFIIALPTKTEHSFDAIGIDFQRFGGMAVFARFGKLPEKHVAADMFLDGHPGVRQLSLRHRQSNEKLGR